MMNRFLTAACAATMVFAAGCGSSGGGAGIGNSIIYVADGTGVHGGFLYGVDISQDPVELHLIGQLKDADGLYYPITGLVLHTDGNLYGSTVDAGQSPQGDLFVQIDRGTGEVTPIDLSGDDDDCFQSVNDLELIEGEIYAIGSRSDCFFTISTDGGVETIIDDPEDENFDYGALAYDAAEETAYYAPWSGISDNNGLFTIDPADGTLDFLTNIDDPADEDDYVDDSYMKAMTVVDGRLLAVVGSEDGHTVLIEIDPDDGSIEILGLLPTNADAIARVAN